jgi:hypothetical protein
VAVGDQVRVYEFERGQTRLAAELSGEELTWSRSTPIPFDQMKGWFGAAFKGVAPAARAAEKSYTSTARKFIIIMLVLNAIPLLFSFSNSVFYNLIGALVIYLPARFLDAMEKRNQS